MSSRKIYYDVCSSLLFCSPQPPLCPYSPFSEGQQTEGDKAAINYLICRSNFTLWPVSGEKPFLTNPSNFFHFAPFLLNKVHSPLKTSVPHLLQSNLKMCSSISWFFMRQQMCPKAECHPDPRETPRRLKFVSKDGRVCFSLFKVIILVWKCKDTVAGMELLMVLTYTL